MNKETVLAIRVTESFRAAVHAAAKEADLKTSEFIRQAIKDKLYGRRPGEAKNA